MAAPTTTVKVRITTRDLLRSIGAERHQSADEVIVCALAALQRDQRRRIAAAEARAISNDPDDLAEIRAIWTTSPLIVKGETYRLPARGRGHEQRGRRFAVVLQPDWLSLSTWIVAFTSTRARATSFRPSVVIGGRETLVLCDQLATVGLNRLTEPVGFLTLEEMQRVDDALCLVLDL